MLKLWTFTRFSNFFFLSPMDDIESWLNVTESDVVSTTINFLISVFCQRLTLYLHTFKKDNLIA